MRFRDRTDAGVSLAAELGGHVDDGTIVLALPRGGVQVGAQVASRLGVPLDLVVARKIGHPENPEFAVGAVIEDGTVLIDSEHAADVDKRWLDAEAQRRLDEARELRERYTPGEACPNLCNRTVILIDDGAATGLTAHAAIKSARRQGAKKVIVGLPVAPRETISALGKEADAVVVVHAPEYFVGAVGAYYDDFHPLSDDDVVALLGAFRRSVV